MAGPRRGDKKGGARRTGGRAGPRVRRGTVRLSHDVARKIRLGHPWVYREAIARTLRERPGDPLELVDHDGDFVGRGVMDGETAISVRVVTRDPDQQVSPALLAARARAAVAFRRRFLDFDAYQAIRLVNAESDGIPAMAIDRYGDYLVAQLFSSAALAWRDPVYEALAAELSPAAIYEQRRFRSLGGEAPRPAELVRGEPAPVDLEVREGDYRFWVDVTAPLSTGLFADLREGRRCVASWAKGRRVLNLFSYTGTIGVYAAKGGATEVAAVDVAAKAHARARKNFAANGFADDHADHIVGDVFKVLARFAERGRDFDMVVIDPPAFASGSRGGKPWSAVKDYGELVSAALDVLVPGGVFVAASSTRKMNIVEFEQALADGAMRSRTSLRIVERCGLPIDFPTTPGFPEANYLKFVVSVRD